MKTISINRAPVLTLWAAVDAQRLGFAADEALTLWTTVVPQRLGFDEDEALTLGKAVAGLNAEAKGRRLGSFFDCPVKVNGRRWPQFRHGPGIATPPGAMQWLHPPIRDSQRGKGITNES